MEQPDPFFLISFSDGYEMLKQSESRKKYLISLKKIIPENPVLYIFLGDVEKSENHSDSAKTYYLKARELAEKSETQWLGEIDLKLKGL
ncbi:hypothetical protein [Aegicerativicinus sediminis]|uniref:hypothetical protein n=1 Tax=Aegicerativicinus sediminis TaxID=2893202 RepID=UPI001E42B161|nr:hypothetical protein [Aegicerativicinus sediminis]